jgi:mycofactocin precursor
MSDTPASPATDEVAEAAEPTEEHGPELVLEDLIVEDVSIDGMCGVY